MTIMKDFFKLRHVNSSMGRHFSLLVIRQVPSMHSVILLKYIFSILENRSLTQCAYIDAVGSLDKSLGTAKSLHTLSQTMCC